MEIPEIVVNSGKMVALSKSVSEILGITMALYTAYMTYLLYTENVLWKTIFPGIFISILVGIFLGIFVPVTIIPDMLKKRFYIIFLTYFLSFVMVVLSLYRPVYSDLKVIGISIFFMMSLIHLALALKSRGILTGEDNKVLMYYILIPCFSGLLKKSEWIRKRPFVKAIFLYLSLMFVVPAILSFSIVFTFSVLGYLSYNFLDIWMKMSFFGFVSALIAFAIVALLIGIYLKKNYKALSGFSMTIKIRDKEKGDEKNKYEYTDLNDFIKDVYCSLYAPDLYNEEWVEKYSSYLFLFLLGSIYLSFSKYYDDKCKVGTQGNENSEKQIRQGKVLKEEVAFLISFHEFTKIMLTLPEWIIVDKRMCSCFVTYLKQMEIAGNPGSVVVLESEINTCSKHLQEEGLIFQGINPIKVEYHIKQRYENH